MNTQEIITRIEKERKETQNQLYSAEGLRRLKEIAALYNGEYRLIWSLDLLAEILNRPKITLFKTNLAKLDELIGGFKAQQLITLSAHSKHGKTAFALFLIEKLAELNPVMIPLEQSNEELVQQRNDSNYSIPRFLSPKALAARVTVDWVEERVVEGIAKYNTQFVIIDHLGYIDDFGADERFRRENLAYRIEMVMKSLKNLAKKWNVIILLLVHISQNDESYPPTLRDLKGSSSILQESDMVLMLWRKNKTNKKIRLYENKVMLSVLANRRTGKNGQIGLEFLTDRGIFQANDEWIMKWESELKADQDLETFGEN